jgi:hypothetical protein
MQLMACGNMPGFDVLIYRAKIAREHGLLKGSPDFRHPGHGVDVTLSKNFKPQRAERATHLLPWRL